MKFLSLSILVNKQIRRSEFLENLLENKITGRSSKLLKNYVFYFRKCRRPCVIVEFFIPLL